MEHEFEFTWCEYLTKCPNRKNVEIGSYDCEQCPFFEKSIIIENNMDKCKQFDNKRYVQINKGVVTCKLKKCLAF